MDGENNGKPYSNGWFGGKTHYFPKHPYAYSFFHNHMQVENGYIWKPNYYWRDPFLTSMITGGSVANKNNLYIWNLKKVPLETKKIKSNLILGMHTDFQIFRCANYCDLFPPTDLEEPRNACCFGWTFLELPPAIQKSIWKVELWASHKWPLRSRELWAWSLITVFFEDHLVTWTIGVIVWWSFCTLSEMRNDDTIFDYYVRKKNTI